ncbi:hypothetical protein BP6252_03518 [Coleophoma cylindrospora]|uniref:Uncharacterized protein n=1 Tax=Coleophoma cylindrospora TaxID=1849047 RepID=A0A3D8S7X6_9HELO|nr:hypothetical protein BP6252_03518 [Coleophoma cylindrospora]
MRLLRNNNNSKFSLAEDFGDKIPCYAILSHTWGMETEEVTFKDVIEGTGEHKDGYKKIRFCAQQAANDGLEYFWVDTCCIDKSSSAELQESINSMFRWYQDASRCYVYLSDVSTDDCDHTNPALQPWQQSRWFTRGWTLQELIAPRSVEFFCSKGKRLGDKNSLEQQLSRITGIPVQALQGTNLSMFSVKDRLSWAETRTTKKEEDKAYSLFGLFDIHMSLLYGEGEQKALDRLKDEVLKQGKKRQREEISDINYNKRLKLSISSSQDLDPLDDAAIKRSLLDQLYFTKIDERLTHLAAAQGTTCRWFLNKPEYILWHDQSQQLKHGNFLWIKGNPGTGKSTLMKLLFEEEAKLKLESNLSQITLSFFFLARGTIEEKSTTGLYRSLLHQLFEKAVDLRDSLDWLTADGARSIQRDGWSEEALKRTLKDAVLKLRTRPLKIFVDALDECHTNQVAGMVCFFEELCNNAKESQVCLQICLSSRHYPTIVIQMGIEVILENEIEHMEDIKQYIKSKMRLGKSKKAEALRSEILEKSSGIFLWVVLVVDILNSEYPGSSIQQIRERVKEIPPKLAELFEMILTRYQENAEQLDACLKWILFATRPLQPQELYFAIQLGLDKEYSSYWDQEDIDIDQIKTFVRRSSKGLAEITRNKASEVQFIHESVRDYLLGKYQKQLNFVGYSHEFLKHCCVAQLNASISQNVEIPALLPQGSEAVELQKNIILKFPFLKYSVTNIFHHANIAQQNSIKQTGFITDFPLQRWVFLNNTLEKHKIRRYTESVNMLYILAERNLADLIKIHPNKELCFKIEDERYGPPFFAALATGSDEAICRFLDTYIETQPLNSSLYNLCKRYRQNRKKWANFGPTFSFSRKRSIWSYVAENDDEMLLLLLIGLGECELNFKDGAGRTPLLWAAQNGHEAVVKLLLETGKVDADSEDNDGRTPLWWAAQNGREAIAKLLLETGKVEADSKDNDGWTPLWRAAQNGHEAVVKLLLETSKVDTDSTDKDSQTLLTLLTLLSWAAQNGRKAVVKLLLETGKVDADSKDEYGRTPLWWAAHNGREAVVKLLLETGRVEVDLKDKDGQTPLWRAAQNGHEAVAKLLLKTGRVEVDLKDKDGQTPLWCAAQNGREAIVKLLLETGKVQVDSKGNNDQTPLWWAARYGHEAVVKLLLETGKVDPDSKDKDGQTPLWWAARYGHEAVVKLLLETGKVDADSKDEYGRTPLWQAAQNGHEAVAKLLLKTGKVEVDSKDKDGQTLLSRAAWNGQEAVVKLLLETGKVDADSKDNYGRTPLGRAAQNRHEAVVKLLLETGNVEVDLKDKYGQTPLWWAAQNGHEAVAKLLLKTGKVEVDSKDNNGQTPLWWAARYGHEAVVKLLFETGKVEVDSKDNNGWTPLSQAARYGHLAVVKLLLETGKVDAESKDEYGRTPLWWVARYGHEAVVKLLLETGKVDADSKDEYGRTPLGWAAQNGHEAVVKLLLETGRVEVDLKDKYGQTPLWWAARYGHEAVVKLLLETDMVKADLKDNYGQSPLYWAARYGHKAVVKLLRENVH